MGVAVRSVPLGSPIAKEWLSMISSSPASPSSGHGGHGHFYEDAISSPQMRTDRSAEELPEIGDKEEEEIKVFELVRGSNIYSCTMHNNLNFASREELMKHVSKHTKQHVCEECQKSYASKYNLEAHIAKFHKGVTGVFKCTVPGCTVTLKTKGGFYKHFNREHKCRLCNKDFAGANELEEHECSAKAAPSCKFCQKEFRMLQTCKRHIEESCLANPEVLGKSTPTGVMYVVILLWINNSSKNIKI